MTTKKFGQYGTKRLVRRYSLEGNMAPLRANSARSGFQKTGNERGFEIA
jgi:hypothetical protein